MKTESFVPDEWELQGDGSLADFDQVGGDREAGGVTAEYAIAILTAAGFAGLLLAILQSDTVRGWLLAIVERALG
ncbi:MAG: DUF4244 domain-containing protein [Bifidobacteriaceae bacterium]|nr:DUF4244 domain-containing protein [Bifidobacteriaceae bacterium]